jgi:hypothetical protein
MKTDHRLAVVVAAMLCVSAASVWTAEHVWQKGTWREMQVKRPKVVFGIVPNSPNTGVPRSSVAATQEIRTYVIDTGTTRLELQEYSTADAPRIDVLPGDPVEFAVEKKNVWVKDKNGREHKLTLVKETRNPR